MNRAMKHHRLFRALAFGLLMIGLCSVSLPATAATTAKPDPLYDSLIWTLPTGASPVRLSLPASINDIFAGPKNGVVGFGLHAGGHIEGLDHVWIELRAGVPVKSWAEGKVLEVFKQSGEYVIRIDYGRNLFGTHMEIQKPYVRKGQRILRGQKVGLGMSFDPEQSSAEFFLEDLGRVDGIKQGTTGSLVSPYDYLRPSQKKLLVDAYKKYILNPFLATGVDDNQLFEKYEPYLTNRINLARRTKGKIEGVWYYLNKWQLRYPNDILTFIRSNNAYYRGTTVLGMDDESLGEPSSWSINGSYEVDYTTHHLYFTNHDDGREYFCLFKIEPWRGRERLTIEFGDGTYPTTFSTRALKYASRTLVPRREDAVKLGVRSSL